MPSSLSRRAVLRGTAMIGATATVARVDAASSASSDFRGDADLLSRAYGALHPGLHRYNSAAQMDARFMALRQMLAARPTLSDAYSALARCTAAVRCGHSYPNFYNQSDTVQSALFNRPDKLPFLFRWIGDRMIVTRDVSQPPLPPGTEVRAIEGVAAGRLLRGLMPYARADGHNDAKRRRILDVEAIDRFQAFDIYAPMLWPFLWARGTVRIAATLPDGRSLRRDIALMTLAQRQAVVPPIDARPENAILWSMDRKPGGVACLTMPSWSVYNGRWDWAAWLDARLDEIASDGTRALIVDLRGNEGGLDCGNAILARLVDRPLTPLRTVARVRARHVPADIRPHVDTWDKSFYDWGERIRGPQQDGFFELAADADDANGGLTIHPDGRRFRGKLIVLTDAGNSSATFGFAQLVKASRLGLLIGEPTGGNRRGINGGAFLFLRLPASGIEVDLPMIGYFPSGDQPDAGILPDVRVEESAADIATGFDRTMVVALSHARSLA